MSLKFERNQLGLTQKQLAEKSGLNVRWIQKVENGEISLDNVTVANAFKLLKALYADSKDDTLKDCYDNAKTGYIMIREILKPDEK